MIWFEGPQAALSDAARFLAYALNYASHEDMRTLRRYVADEEFLALLDRVPPGIVNARSWAYWNLRLGRYPAPPLPERHFDL